MENKIKIEKQREEKTDVFCDRCKSSKDVFKQFIIYKLPNGKLTKECMDYKCKNCDTEWFPAYI